MKILISIIMVLVSFKSFACSCDKYPLYHEEAIMDVLTKKFGKETLKGFDSDTIIHLKAYPTMVERLDLFRMRGTSCEDTGPNGEFLYHCINKTKSDYLIRLQNCEVVVQAKSNFKRAIAKIKSTVVINNPYKIFKTPSFLLSCQVLSDIRKLL